MILKVLFQMSALLRASQVSPRALRSITNIPRTSNPYIGSSQPDLPPDQLPSIKEVLQLVAWSIGQLPARTESQRRHFILPIIIRNTRIIT